MATAPLRIAIIGGGLAGASLANALVRLPHLDIQVYESAPGFSERGAAVGLSANAQVALQQILPSAKEMLAEAGAVPMNATRIVIGSGEGANTIIADLAGNDPGLVVHRASLLRSLLNPLPKEALHANKKFATIKATDGCLVVTFADGTVETFDAVIGADGIFSSVRTFVLQDMADAHGPSPAGFWDCRVLVPYDKAKTTIGDQYFEVDRQYGWLGDGAFIMHDILENRTMVQCVVSAVEREPPRERKRPLSRENLETTLRHWMDGPIAKGIIELILDQPAPQGYSQWEHKSTPTYANGSVCIVGDAAHAMSPWQGAGAGQALEDAMILGTLFANVSKPQDIPAAFKAFDAVRRPRCQKIIDSSRGTGLIFCAQDEQIGLDPDKLRSALASRWAVIFSLDMEEYKKETLTKMREFQMEEK